MKKNAFSSNISCVDTKKRHRLSDVFWRVPGGTRTHDIQNHNLSWKSLYPVDSHHVNELSNCSSVNYK